MQVYEVESKSWYQGLRYALDKPEDARECRSEGDKYLSTPENRNIEY